VNVSQDKSVEVVQHEMKRECAEKCAPCLNIAFLCVLHREINVLHPEVTASFLKV